ncbi:MAG: hypothetical protein JXA96_07600 [Sedimentisphaerales bacterium]|nr:hypothetical protein [Sedimentisphaerales bacterium]
MDYELYHDESKVHGYWHGILLVPIESKPLVIEYLEKVRKYTRYEAIIGIKKIKTEGKIFSCAEAWLDYCIGAMITQFNYKYPHQIFTGERIRDEKQYEIFENIVNRNPLGLKFILFRDKDQFKNMYNSLDHGGKIEVSFRIAAKSGLHYLFSEENHIRIKKIHFDGYEHHGRNIDKKRIIERLNGLRNYCYFKENCSIDDRSSKHNRENCQLYEDCQLLQLTDLLIGSFRTALGYYGQGNIPAQKTLANHVQVLIERYKKGYARMRYSRWKDSFCISESYIENEKWQFQDIEYAKKSEQKTFWGE